MKLPDWKLWRDRFRNTAPSDRFLVRVLSPDQGLFKLEEAPIEIRFVLQKKPEWQSSLEHLFDRGFGIGIRSIPAIPKEVEESVATLRDASQHGVLEPWLSRLILKDEIPVFTEEELHFHYEQGANLFDVATMILEYRYEMKRFILIDLENKGIEDRDWHLIEDMNRELREVSARYLIHRIHEDMQDHVFHPVNIIFKSVVIIGSLAQLLESWVRGMGLLFAAIADDVFHEGTELASLRGSGLTWKQLLRRSRIAIPMLILAAWFVLSIPSLLDQGSTWMAGFLFGVAAILFPLGSCLEWFGSLMRAYDDLLDEKKLAPDESRSAFALFRDECRHRYTRQGLVIGMLLTPFISGCLFYVWPWIASNGWILGALASTEIGIAFVYGSVNKQKSNQRFERQILVTNHEAK